MDLGFLRRVQSTFASRSAARLDYRVMVATLEAVQSSTAAARAVRGLGPVGDVAPRHDGLVEIVLGGPAWREAVASQHGSFNPAWAKRLRQRG
jgi:hypothetical protein